MLFLISFVFFTKICGKMTKFNFKEKEFLWNSDKLSWTEALKTCQEYGGSLASIRSKGKVKPMDTLKKPRKENVSELCPS